MSVRKRIWQKPSGETKTAWIVDFVDGRGMRHIKTFNNKEDAQLHQAVVGPARKNNRGDKGKNVMILNAAEIRIIIEWKPK